MKKKKYQETVKPSFSIFFWRL